MTPIAHLSIPSNTVTLLKTAIATVGNQTTYCEANILFDEGAQRSFITKDLATRLQLQSTEREFISVSGFGAQTSAARSLESTVINLKTSNNDEIPLRVLIVERIATPLQLHSRHNINKIPHLKGLQLAHPITSDENFEISLLVGADQYWKVVEDQVIRGNGPTAMKSKVGYLLSGPLEADQPVRSVANFLQLSSTKQDEYDLQQFWSLESLGITPPTQDDPHKRFLEQYQRSSIKRDMNGTYIAGFPWKSEHPPLPTNYTICEARTRSMARRLKQTPELLKTYSDIIAEYESRGFIEKVQTPRPLDTAHYIPHHPVKKESSTTPIRIVFNCSCRQHPDSPSLNDCIEVGPPFLNDLCGILLRFRTYPYGISTDIEKAFLHVGLNKSDRDFTRFFLLSDPSDPESAFDTYRFKVVLFGSASSPFMLNATLHTHLNNHESDIAKDIKNDLYVDNFISGCDSEEEILQYYNEARSIMAEGNFNLRSWASNSKVLHTQATVDNVADKNEVVNLLGLKWTPSTDTLSLNPKPTSNSPKMIYTKREILRQASKTYDPLGLISPVTIKAKIFMQELWKQHLEWDEPLSTELSTAWAAISKEIGNATQITLPRSYFQHSHSNLNDSQLHVFADASTKAYGAVAYLCSKDQTSLVISKSRVAPLKQLTLPQLELMAALTAARLASFVKQALERRCSTLSIHMWSDSEIVLHWLNSNKILKQFIANRVEEIKQLFPNTHWNYCPTKSNPADLLTRGINAHQLQSSILWKNGPEWLLCQARWPSWNPTKVLHTSNIDIPKQEAVAKESTPLTATRPGIHHVIDISRHSTLNKLLNVTAYVLRFVKILMKQPSERGSPTVAERRVSQDKWILNSQELTYSKEIENIQSKSRNRLPLVRQLRLFTDEKGFIRCGGRLHNAPLAEHTRFPYLLPTNHSFTALIVYDTHDKQLHSGIAATVTALRQTYWIISMRQYVKKLLRQCVTCKRVDGIPFKAPDPAPLPKIRMQQTIPFSVTGVDYTGPLYVRSNNGERKGYICLFTCAATRALHLEVTPDLTERSFLQAFRRFASRKSLPNRMVSDNASTFTASAEELKELFQSPSLKQTLTNRGVVWQFIPKRAPWFGGFWERLIGLTKKSLKKILGRSFITLGELQTIVVEIEAILNDRPLTYISSDIQDDTPLTPAHLLYGRRITSLPYPENGDEINDPNYGDDSELRRRNNLQAAILERFWSRWRHEYLTSLREFHRSSGNNEQTIKKGEIVMVHDEKPRNAWKLAVIEELILRERRTSASGQYTYEEWSNNPTNYQTLPVRAKCR
jgi:transposase InsO family protein